MRRIRIIKHVVLKIKTPYAASEKQMRRIVCINTIQRQQNAEKYKKNKNTQKIKITQNRKIKHTKTVNMQIIQ